METFGSLFPSCPDREADFPAAPEVDVEGDEDGKLKAAEVEAVRLVVWCSIHGHYRTMSPVVLVWYLCLSLSPSLPPSLTHSLTHSPSPSLSLSLALCWLFLFGLWRGQLIVRVLQGGRATWIAGGRLAAHPPGPSAPWGALV